MKAPFFILLIGSICLALVQSDVPRYTCPPPGGEPVEVIVPTDAINHFKFETPKARKSGGAVCILTRVVAVNPATTGLDTFSISSNSGDFMLTPVSRSYRKKNWERVAGPYANRLKVKVLKSQVNVLKVPLLPNLPDGKFFLLAFKHKISKRARLSRFFTQATFGPTTQMLDNFPYPINKNGFSKWVQDQVSTTPTLHRDYFRKYSDFSINGDNRSGFSFSAHHPCESNSRWIDYVFTGADFNKNFEVLDYRIGQFLIVVDGEPRTVVNEFKDTRNPASYEGQGTYIVSYALSEVVGGQVYFRKQGQPVRALLNPKIVLPQEVIDEYSMRVIELQGTFEELEGQSVPEREFWKGGTCLRLQESTWNTQEQACTDIGDDYSKLLGVRTLSDGTKDHLHYAGYGDLQENTIKSPIEDGGASKLANGVRVSANTPPNSMNLDSCRLGRAYINPGFNHDGGFFSTVKDNALVCGSSGEVGNNLAVEAAKSNIFHLFPASSSIWYGNYKRQKNNVFFMTALESPDQLRQRVAWALAQIFVVTPNQIDNSDEHAEIFLHYHDIFVRNAFGNYKDILKEVSYSPMMGEMLSFVGSRSSAYVLFNENRESRPDENFSREIMQLFSIGIYMLNQDGSIQYDDNGSPVPSYDNTDIQTLARAWTGFTRHNRRGNREGYDQQFNRLDPMHIESVRRDQFPKMDLMKGYIGDTYPLCEDLPERQFLRIGAEYRLLGSHPLPILHSEPTDWENLNSLMRFSPSPDSALYNLLCNPDGSGDCQFIPSIKLKENLDCFGDECELDSIRVVLFGDVYYEYIRPPCVELSFYLPEELSKVVDKWDMALCLHKKVPDGAMASCCDQTSEKIASNYCEFTAERVSWETSDSRCKTKGFHMCDVKNIQFPDQKCDLHKSDSNEYFEFVWSNATCSIQARVESDGVVALVHNPSLGINDVYPEDGQYVLDRVNATNPNSFKVMWTDFLYPSTSNQCGSEACEETRDGCLCNVTVDHNVAFTAMPSLSDIQAKLKIGSPNPESFDPEEYTLVTRKRAVIRIYQQTDEDVFSKNTIFSIKYHGNRIFLKNIVSSVSIGTEFSFRNPPRFMSFTSPEGRDAAYETDSVLDNYLYHPNTPPFVATRLIQRFGHSNPSPRYISIVSTAFKSGVYDIKKLPTFGNGQYGNLEATVAAVLLDREAVSFALDADPSVGSLREPLVKFISFMRSMEFEAAPLAREIRMERLLEGIGQEAHATPDVFSFFLPEYAAPGQIIDASLTSPEAQVMNAPTIVGFLNGIFSLIDFGLTRCYGGFGQKSVNNCGQYRPGDNSFKDPEIYSHGSLRYATTATSTSDIVDELAILLTGGRISANVRTSLLAAYDSESANSDNAGALRLVQKLIVSFPEFHSTNVFQNTGNPRPEPETPEPSPNPYKAIVFLNLNGGMDGFNMLVPHSDCHMYQKYRDARGSIALEPNQLLEIDAATSNLVCEKFGVHYKLPSVRDRFVAKDLAFITNMGILQHPVSKENWRQLHDKTALFAHNTQTEETATLDIFGEMQGGVGGRILDALTKGGYKTGAISVSGSAPPIVSKSTPLLVVNPSGYEKFNQVPWAPDIVEAVKAGNSATTVGSSFYGDIWSNLLYQSLSENSLLYDKYKDAPLNVSFNNNHLGRQFAAVSKLIKTKDGRGKDRDIFFVERSGFDHHTAIDDDLSSLFDELDGALSAFQSEMISSSLWDDVTVVLVSEFARTLMGNSGDGSDHAWGGNYWVTGGKVDGGKILGSYPDNLSNEGPLVFRPGIVIPTTPWESLWSAVADWFGVDESEMDFVLPNRKVFSNLWTAGDLYKD